MKGGAALIVLLPIKKLAESDLICWKIEKLSLSKKAREFSHTSLRV